MPARADHSPHRGNTGIHAFTLIISSVSGLSVTDKVLESSSLKDRMAKYKAAVGKQETTNSVSSVGNQFKTMCFKHVTTKNIATK